MSMLGHEVERSIAPEWASSQPWRARPTLVGAHGTSCWPLGEAQKAGLTLVDTTPVCGAATRTMQSTWSPPEDENRKKPTSEYPSCHRYGCDEQGCGDRSRVGVQEGRWPKIDHRQQGTKRSPNDAR
jgi:hypothetical protein